MDNSDLAKRMKEYESVSKTKLIRRMPVIIRIDGRAFHTFTKGFKRPFDEVLIKSMQDTMKYLCENIQNCVLGYHQSDEITLLLVDYKELNTSPWFDNEVQKICSITASMATMAFNKYFQRNVEENILEYKCSLTPQCVEIQQKAEKYHRILREAVYKRAMFDTRCFNIPKDDVTNNFYWRQLDATRNSIQMVGQAHFSHRELQNKNCNEIQDMLFTKKGINWNDFATPLKRGSCCIKETYKHDDDTLRTHWIIDKEIPVFKGEKRDYIDKLVYVGE